MGKNNKPRILSFDIETMANKGYYFELYKEGNILRNIEHWYMLSFAWKWLDEKKTHVLSLPDFKGYKKNKTNDRDLTEALWKLFDEADVVIAHNGQAFDVKKANALFLKHGFPPPSPYKVVDTKLVAKRYFRFDSNKLDDLADFLSIGRKLQTGGFDLWLECEAGIQKSWDKMCRYNIHDVILLEKVYKRMLPFITNHPNIALMRGEHRACPNCGSANIQKRGFVYTNTSVNQSWYCWDCKSRPQSPLKDNTQVR